MTDEKPKRDEPCETGSGFVIPGTQDTVCNEDPHAHLEHCAHCGASLSSSSEFCQVCSTAVSGGDYEPAADSDTSGDAAS